MTVIPLSQKAAVIKRAQALLGQRGETQRSVAAKVGIGQSTLNEWLKQIDDGEPEGAHAFVETHEGEATIGTSPSSSIPEATAVTAEAFLKKHGFDSDEWVVTSVRVSEWGKEEAPMFQLRVNAKRRDSLVIIPDLAKFEPWAYGQIEEYAARQVAIIPDIHAPFHDERALHAVCDLLATEAPEEVIFIGDVSDVSFLSKHRTHRRFITDLNRTNDAVVQNFRHVREAAPESRIIFIPGNHDDRLLYYTQDMAPEFVGVRPGRLHPDAPEPEQSLGFRSLWQLDTLGIELVDEDWKLAQHPVTAELTARHGYLVGNNSERKLLEKHGRSQVHGHDHRATITYRTKHDPMDVRVAMSCGTLCEIKPDGLGYEPDPDWTPGMGWCQVWEDGLFQLSFLPYVKNKLLTPWGAAYEGKE